jgi:hypothetical protein
MVLCVEQLYPPPFRVGSRDPVSGGVDRHWLSMKSGLESLWYPNRNMGCLWMVNWVSNRNGFANDKSRKLSICQTIKIGFRPRKDGWSVVNIGNIHPSRGMIRIHKEYETTEPHSELQIGPWEVRQYEPQKGLQHLTTSYPWKLNRFLDVFVVYQYLTIVDPG